MATFWSFFGLPKEAKRNQKKPKKKNAQAKTHTSNVWAFFFKHPLSHATLTFATNLAVRWLAPLCHSNYDQYEFQNDATLCWQVGRYSNNQAS